MYLKSIEVHGFKSFAKKMTFEFHDGITAIVGPNGSGKSNVADAVRWVLGEQSARQLRGAKMEDVIFAGTQNRKPQGYAYVAITINNADHKLPLDYEEVTIARRVYRSGESEYLLNGTTCRLRDVQELLFDTGIGKEGYSIIGQGQIDKILSGKPDERRELFDEAAGIVKFKKRKAQAEKNLEEEQNNLVRIEDILSELEKQVGPLEKQSEKAKEYLALRDSLKKLDINVFLMDYERIHKDVDVVEENIGIAGKDLAAVQDEFARTKAEYDVVERQMEEKNHLVEEKRKNVTENSLHVKQMDGDIKVLKEQIHAAEQSEGHFGERIKSIQKTLDASRREQEKYQAGKEETDEKVATLRALQDEMEKESQTLQSELEKTEAKLESCNRAIKDYMSENSKVGAQKQKFQTLLEQNSIQKAELTQQILKNKSEAAALDEAMEREKQNLLEISDKIIAINKLNNAHYDHVQRINKELEALHGEQESITARYHMENSRLHSLKNITERYEGYGQSIRRVMERKDTHPGIVGVVADIISVKKEYEVAVETALGGSIQNIVTKDEKTAKDLIAYLKKNRYGRATFLPLTNISSRNKTYDAAVFKEPGVIGLASELVDADDAYNDLIGYLLGRFVLVDHIDNATALARKYRYTLRIVTKEGELINPGGSLSGGAYKNNSNLLGRRREMETLEQNLREIQKEQEAKALRIAELEKEKQSAREKMAANDGSIKELGLKQNTAKLTYDRAASDKEDNELELADIMSTADTLDRQREELTAQMDTIVSQMEENKERTQDNELVVSALQEEIDGLREKSADKNSQLEQTRIELTTLEQNVEFANENIRRVSEDTRHYEKELASVNAEKENAARLVEEKQQDIIRVEKEMADLESQNVVLEEEIQKITGEREELTRQHKGFFEKHEEMSGRISGLEKEIIRLESQKERMTEQMTGYMNYMWEQYELTYHSAVKERIEVEGSYAQLKKQMGDIKESIKKLGDVNVNAINDYKELMERYQLLHTQHDDLIKAEEALQKIIDDLDEEMRAQFSEKFSEIQERFDTVFKELFGGGQGTLELMEDEDILEAGIKINAQPPGKKLQNMMQLSGGEKALSAIALLFAIQSLKPSPFCLLDEIEAALDDSNVGRFAKYLHKLTKDTQFIVITHRRGTMAAADILYGITMQEKGVSTLVSVNLLDEENEALA